MMLHSTVTLQLDTQRRTLLTTVVKSSSAYSKLARNKLFWIKPPATVDLIQPLKVQTEICIYPWLRQNVWVLVFILPVLRERECWVWIWNVPHRRMCMNTWPPAGGVLRGCRSFRIPPTKVLMRTICFWVCYQLSASQLDKMWGIASANRSAVASAAAVCTHSWPSL